MSDAFGTPVLELRGAHVTEGAGMKLSIPRVVGAREWIAPVLRWFDPGEGMSPYIADLFPCDGWFCRKKYAAELDVHIFRAKKADMTEPNGVEERLRYRATRILEEDKANRGKKGQILDPREARAVAETMQIFSSGDGKWARFEIRFKDGSLGGTLYIRVVDRELTAYVSFLIESTLPKGVTVETLEKAFETFVSGIRIESVKKE